MRHRSVFVILVAAVLCATPALAQCKKTCEKAKPCQSKSQDKGCSHGKTISADGHHAKHAHEHAEGAKSAMCTSDVTCDGDLVRHEGIELPRIGFKVGEKITCCMKSATEMSAGDPAKIKFVVADKTYVNQGEAMEARLTVLGKYYEHLLTVEYAVGDECTACPLTAKDLAHKSGKPIRYRLAASDFADKAQAENVAAEARAAGERITMSWVVGEETFCCPGHAGQAAEKNDKKLEYRVGEQTTVCETTAKTRLIETRIAAVLETVAKAVPS